MQPSAWNKSTDFAIIITISKKMLYMLYMTKSITIPFTEFSQNMSMMSIFEYIRYIISWYNSYIRFKCHQFLRSNASYSLSDMKYERTRRVLCSA